MIRLIAAIDNNRGIAKADRIPWNLSSDKARFRKLTLDYGANVLMGRKTYDQMGDYLLNKHAYVASHMQIKLRPNITLVNDLDKFVANFKNDLWVIGGAGVYQSTIKYADELYLTIVDKDFNCDQFFPEYQDFKLAKEEGPYSENGLSFNYQLLIRL